ncbi:hypothetical protein [Curtobacterium sp. MCBD17_019]|uniref:hypothetical protein n=1 Tax=Curtobacterium sp. MCBD17_019 TaxID=2175669 RepID=UPI000DA8A7B8|nr:hypothetical protein [Curtobacterium sp. MCBD17_019]PZE75433.1 hypothetical protein DEI82_08910 [Curtobacterium sp. MCBD17_019]
MAVTADAGTADALAAAVVAVMVRGAGDARSARTTGVAVVGAGDAAAGAAVALGFEEAVVAASAVVPPWGSAHAISATDDATAATVTGSAQRTRRRAERSVPLVVVSFMVGFVLSMGSFLPEGRERPET